MKEFFKKFGSFISKTFNQHMLIVAILIWIVSFPVLRWLDPTSGTFDSGIFQIPLFAIIIFFVVGVVTWFAFNKIHGTQSNYIRTKFKDDFQNLDPWQKIKLSYFLYFAFYFGLITLMSILIKG